MTAPEAHRQTTAVIHRISRGEGHLRAIKKMVEEGRPCPEILVQLAAVKGAIDQIARIVLEDHVETCLRRAAAAGTADEDWGELKEALKRYMF